MPTAEKAVQIIRILDYYTSKQTEALHNPEGIRQLIERYVEKDAELSCVCLRDMIGTNADQWEGLRRTAKQPNYRKH